MTKFKAVSKTLYKLRIRDCQHIVDMIDFNSYIKGLDLSRLTEYCVNHGHNTLKAIISLKQVKSLGLLGLLNVATSTI